MGPKSSGVRQAAVGNSPRRPPGLQLFQPGARLRLRGQAPKGPQHCAAGPGSAEASGRSPVGRAHISAGPGLGLRCRSSTRSLMIWPTAARLPLPGAGRDRRSCRWARSARGRQKASRLAEVGILALADARQRPGHQRRLTRPSASQVFQFLLRQRVARIGQPVGETMARITGVVGMSWIVPFTMPS